MRTAQQVPVKRDNRPHGRPAGSGRLPTRRAQDRRRRTRTTRVLPCRQTVRQRQRQLHLHGVDQATSVRCFYRLLFNITILGSTAVRPKTRLSSNLRRTTHIVTSGHATKMAVIFDPLSRKPHAARKLYGSVLYRTGIIPDRILHCGNRNFRAFCCCDLDLDPMTFIDELNPYSLNMYPQTTTFCNKAFESSAENIPFYAYSPVKDVESSVSLCVECYFN